MIEHLSTTFNETSMFGDNTNRVDDVMSSPSVGLSSVVRYKVPDNKLSKVQCMALTCDFSALLLSGAYNTAQNGAVVQLRFDTVVKFEQKFNWTGLAGYIGGADDYNAENEVMLTGYDTHIDASTVIDVRITGSTNVRRMVYAVLYGVLDDGTKVRADIRTAVNGTTAVNLPLYTVPAGRILDVNQIVVTRRHIDLYAGKGYLTFNGLAVLGFDVMQTEIGGVYGIHFPFYDLPLAESASIGFRFDSFECGDEIISGTVYASEEIVVPTPAEVAASVWAYADRTLT